MKVIDAHIHLDQYKNEEIQQIMEDTNLIAGLITVSFNLESCIKNLALSKRYPAVMPAFGFHPEQPIPTEKQVNELFDWMGKHILEMTAIGEVGLPYYLRMSQKVSAREYDQYIILLEKFIQKASEWEKPIALHAVHDDAPVVCDLLEKYSIKKAHFHWFKGDQKTIARMKENGYFISVTPDIVYKEDRQQLVNTFPLEQIMIETDGPWPFEGPFSGEMTHPKMMLESIRMIANIKKASIQEVSERLVKNTKSFYFKEF